MVPADKLGIAIVVTVPRDGWLWWQKHDQFSRLARLPLHSHENVPMKDRKRSTPRLWIPSALGQGINVPLEKDKAHYIVNVLRLKAGDGIVLFNGVDGEWLARITETGKKGAAALCEALMRPQPPVADLWLLFAPLKSARLDYLMQKAVEMGASHVFPVITERTQVQRFNADRAHANMIEAAEQCEILAVPTLATEMHLPDVLAPWDAERRMIFCDEEADASNPLAGLQDVPKTDRLALIIGPEGGFSNGERQALLALPKVTRLSLGPRILRADTAAVAAMAVIQSMLGDWQ
jgi:16S rRNA (uracil1498-N3)-methyltransferase